MAITLIFVMFHHRIRKNEYTSKAVCQDDCDFVSYNYTTKKAKCSCKAKKSSSSFADMKIDKNKFAFIEEKKISKEKEEE